MLIIKHQKFFLAGILTLTIMVNFVVASQATAQLWDSIRNEMMPIENVYGGKTDPRLMAAMIIKFLMTFLAIIFLILVIYAGFTWMTAGGNQDKVNKAKSILLTGTIGLGIILMAYAITRTLVIIFGCSADSWSGTWCFVMYNML